MKVFLRALGKKVNADSKQTFSVKELKALAVSENIRIDDFASLITKLNEGGILLKSARDTYKFIDYTS